MKLLPTVWPFPVEVGGDDQRAARRSAGEDRDAQRVATADAVRDGRLAADLAKRCRFDSCRRPPKRARMDISDMPDAPY